MNFLYLLASGIKNLSTLYLKDNQYYHPCLILIFFLGGMLVALVKLPPLLGMLIVGKHYILTQMSI